MKIIHQFEIQSRPFGAPNFHDVMAGIDGGIRNEVLWILILILLAMLLRYEY
jgi:hypothetical protein